MKKETITTLILIVCTVIVVFCITRFVISLTNIIGDSMYPTYKQGDLVLVNRLTKTYHRNDVVIAQKDGLPYIKRIIGLPNETIYADGGNIYINNQYYNDLIDEYTEWYSEKPVTNSNDEYFLLGDNRTVSKDSRMVGSFSKSEITGKVILTIPKWIIIVILVLLGLAFGISFANDKRKKKIQREEAVQKDEKAVHSEEEQINE